MMTGYATVCAIRVECPHGGEGVRGLLVAEGEYGQARVYAQAAQDLDTVLWHIGQDARHPLTQTQGH